MYSGTIFQGEESFGHVPCECYLAWKCHMYMQDSWTHKAGDQDMTL